MSNKTKKQGKNKNYSKSIKSKSYNKRLNNDLKNNKANIWLLLPIIMSMSVLPFITKLKEYPTNLAGFSWFTYNDIYVDFFLFYKQRFFIIITLVMATIIIFRFFVNRKSLYFSHVLIPLVVYVVLALASSVFSEYKSFSFSGIHEHFESIFVLLGYCMLVYYTIVYVKTEKDYEIIINCFIISIIFMGVLALTQYIGKDFFATKIGLRMILNDKYLNLPNPVKFNFEQNRVYLTLHNPNYVGSYVALTAPFLLTLSILIRRNFWRLPLYILALAGTIIALIGSKSKTAIIALLAAGVLALILLYRYIAKYFYFSIPIILLIISTVLLYNKANDNVLRNQLRTALEFNKTEVSLQDIKTLDDEIVITYRNNNLHIRFFSDDTYGGFEIKDDSNNYVDLAILEDGYTGYTVLDERFYGIEIGLSAHEEKPAFYVNIDGSDWFFTNSTEDGSYYLINPYGKLDKIEHAPSALFTGYERYASGRGYIWSRSIPLLKEHIILGSGADTFTLVFPLRDYVNRHNYGFYDLILSKPHNLYLQTGIQTGVISLLAYLTFYGIYFIMSFKLYIKGLYKDIYSQIGVAIFLSTFSYMVVSIANDSILAVAPIYWAMMGLGIATNIKAKKNIDEEIANERAIKETK